MATNKRAYKRFNVNWRARVVLPEQGVISGFIKGASVTGGYLEFPYSVPKE